MSDAPNVLALGCCCRTSYVACAAAAAVLQAGQERMYSQLKGQLQGMVEQLIEQTRRCGGGFEHTFDPCLTRR